MVDERANSIAVRTAAGSDRRPRTAVVDLLVLETNPRCKGGLGFPEQSPSDAFDCVTSLMDGDAGVDHVFADALPATRTVIRRRDVMISVRGGVADGVTTVMPNGGDIRRLFLTPLMHGNIGVARGIGRARRGAWPGARRRVMLKSVRRGVTTGAVAVMPGDGDTGR